MAQTRIMPAGERNEWILDMLRRKFIRLDGCWIWLWEVGSWVVEREEPRINPRILA